MWGGVKVGRCGAGVTVGQDYGVGVGGGTAVRCVGHVVLSGNRVVSILLDQNEHLCKRQLPG
jgi:hypothetical protein